jgi:hypothetical protein
LSGVDIKLLDVFAALFGSLCIRWSGKGLSRFEFRLSDLDG